MAKRKSSHDPLSFDYNTVQFYRVELLPYVVYEMVFGYSSQRYALHVMMT